MIYVEYERLENIFSDEEPKIGTEASVSLSSIKSSIFCLLNWGLKCNSVDDKPKETVSTNFEVVSQTFFCYNC